MGNLKTNISADISAIQSSSTSMQSEISALDKALADLDDEIAALDTEFSNLSLDLELDDLEKEMTQLTNDVKSENFKGAFLEGLYSGIAEGASDILQELVESGLEFIGDSVKAAAESGTQAADDYNRAVARVSLGTQSLQHSIGNFLLPVLSKANDLLADMLGVTNLDMAIDTFERLDAYTFENLLQAEASLANIFAMGEAYEAKQVEMNFDSVIAGYESQVKYWEDYTNTLAELQERGFGADFLAQYTSGAQSDFEQLQWLASLTNDQIKQMQDAADAAEKARINTAAEISGLQLATDDTYLDMVSDYYNYTQRAREENNAGGGIRFGDGDTADHSGRGVRFGIGFGLDDLQAEIDKMTESDPVEIPASFVGSDGQEINWETFKAEIRKDDEKTVSTLDQLDSTLAAMNAAIDNMNAAATALANRQLIAYVDARSLARDTAPYMNEYLAGDS